MNCSTNVPRYVKRTNQTALLARLRSSCGDYNVLGRRSGCCFVARASVVRSWRSPGIAGVGRRSQVWRAHVRVVILRRILGEVPAIQSLKVRPL
jgi:hypothetical protein